MCDISSYFGVVGRMRCGRIVRDREGVGRYEM